MNEEPVYSPQGMGGTVSRIETACWDEPEAKIDDKPVEDTKEQDSGEGKEK